MPLLTTPVYIATTLCGVVMAFTVGRRSCVVQVFVCNETSRNVGQTTNLWSSVHFRHGWELIVGDAHRAEKIQALRCVCRPRIPRPYYTSSKNLRLVT
ncbi:uncharacterized protein BT62DRAFT_223243 [Guyanagaster necrorhizus]|uniref:Uncharacterized protein n=1 Tax=Guyanagaster necrorhizus TaxID=856835 RepID=A0A9P7VP00_9AGAR|nr:uncharacterized protein BT62DRAFT_223243 [Guyanagaster necrorhizus MCA 3950]KAG7444718.1 hypothetical protein BT62DRAFT_223243 [Guyanagaster necrorhizus MCA 3950]